MIVKAFLKYATTRAFTRIDIIGIVLAMTMDTAWGFIKVLFIVIVLGVLLESLAED